MKLLYVLLFSSSVSLASGHQCEYLFNDNMAIHLSAKNSAMSANLGIFEKNRMTSTDAREIFDFLLGYGYPTLAFDHQIGKLIVSEVNVMKGEYKANFGLMETKEDLIEVQKELKRLGFYNPSHPIFN